MVSNTMVMKQTELTMQKELNVNMEFHLQRVESVLFPQMLLPSG